MENSEPDYYMLFVKAFIPYNAWYMMNFYDEDEKRTNDRSIIDFMKSAKPGENRYKDRTVTLLKGNTAEAEDFKRHLACLHFELRKHPIPNAEEAISFKQVYISSKKAEDYEPITIGEYTYSCKHDETRPKKTPRWILEVINTDSQSTEYMVELFKPSLSELVKNDDFIALPTDSMKEGLKDALNEMSPNKTDNLVVAELHSANETVPTGSFVMGDNERVCLVNNTELIAKAVIQILYDLRCKLFHGEIAPTSDYKGIYKHAFFVQSMLIKNLV